MSFFKALSIFNRKSIFAAAVPVLLFASWAQAASWYVDASRGSDTGIGTTAAPFKTIARTQKALKDGDSVIFRSGSYGNLTDNKIHSKYVTYRAESGANAVISNLHVKESAYVKVQDLEITGYVNAYGSKYFQLRDSMVAFAGDRYAVTNLVDIRHSDHALVYNCIITHGRTGIKIDNAKNTTILNNNIYDLAVDGMTATPATNLLVQGNHIHNLRQDRVILRDYWTTIGFTAPNKSVVVSNPAKSSLTLNMNTGFSTGTIAYTNFASGKNFKNMTGLNIAFKSNAAYNAGEIIARISNSANGAASGKWVDVPFPAFSAGKTIKKSFALKGIATMTSVRSVALIRKANRGQSQLVISDWSFSNGAHQDFIVISGSNIKIRNNIMHDGASQGIFTSPANAANVTIENNLMYDLHGTNLTNLSLRGTCVIRNNTFLGYLRPGYESKPLSSNHFMGSVGVIPLDSGAGIKICNNIVAGELSSTGSVNSYNIVQRQKKLGVGSLAVSGANPAGYKFETSFFNRAGFVRAHRKIYDYSLKSGSAAINKGIAAQQSPASLGSLDEDGFVASDGKARTDSKHSCGSREYGSPAGSLVSAASILAPPGDKFVPEGIGLKFELASRYGGDGQLSYSVMNLPSGATFTGRTFVWTPGFNQAGLYKVTFIASDGNCSDYQTITIAVANVNQEPVLEPIARKTVAPNTLVSFDLIASDKDFDVLTYSATGLPEGATLVGNKFAWVPEITQAGAYEITFTVSDGEKMSSQKVQILVGLR
ncbi:MAG: hypothetical protein A2Y07_03610 [Planctomycetes bacterium GWF2_50_10]|nr:MAG: hypothetical protein A2Y07_03610 [Planctomycetes bacterium GWF2_50_10]